MPSSSLINVVNPKGISLWASDIRCLNDSSEGEEGLRIFRLSCQKLQQDGRVSLPFIKKIVNLQPKPDQFFFEDAATGSFIFRDETMDNAYICCFTKHRDNLAMWNYYAKGNRYEGYNIGLVPLEILDNIGKYFGTGIRTHLFEVIYDDIKKTQIVEDTLLLFYHLYLAHNKQHEQEIINDIRSILRYWTLIFKNKAFEHEGEVRIILEAPRAGTCNEAKNPQKLAYRVGNGLIIPYYIVSLSKTTLASITSGPMPSSDHDKELVREIMKDFLKERGYEILESNIRTSDIPVRF
jgi:hypothetical protein